MAHKKTLKFFRFLLLISLFFIIIGGLGLGLAFLWGATIEIPPLDSFENRKVVQSTKIYDRTGEVLLWDVHENIKRTVVPLNDISYNLKNATVAIEDSSFYQHHGVDFVGTLRAIWIDLGTLSFSQGGSTITQQLVKNAMLTNEKKITRKLKEWVLAVRIEKIMSKEKILELYLNEIPYGGSLYGAEAASQNFFGKKASDLTLAESAYLAALPQAPTFYSPYGNNKERLEERKNLVLKKMRQLGFITEEEEDRAKEEVVAFSNKDDNSVKAAHFSIFIRSYLEEKYGQDVVEQEGLKVITTLDYDLQKKAEELVLQYATKNKTDFNASNAGLVAVDPKTGQILSMVGSKDYFNEEDQGNFNITLAHRQPGSSIKPFVYATAFKKGYTPNTVLFDLKTEFNSSCYPDSTPKPGTKADECYSPQNYDNIFRGPMTLRAALAQSINVPSVKTLYLAGMKDSLAVMKDMGIDSLADPNRYGLTLVLGGGEVSLFDMTGAYGVFANAGERNKTTGILKIEDSSGNVLEEFRADPQRALEKNVALIMSDVLSDNEAKMPAYGANSPFIFPGKQVASKTGTTNDSKDAWVLGYTPNLAVGVWCGNNDNTSMVKKVAGLIAAPLWRAFMDEALKNYPAEQFEKPVPQESESIKAIFRGEWRGGETYKVDKISGKLATQYTPAELIEERAVTQIHSILYWVNKNDPLGPAPSSPGADSQFTLWETPIRAWVATQGIKEESSANIPKDYDDVHKPEYSPKITVTSPISGFSYDANRPLLINLNYTSRYIGSYAEFFLNNRYLGSTNRSPFSFSFVPNEKSFVAENSELRVVLYDSMKNRGEAIIKINFINANPSQINEEE